MRPPLTRAPECAGALEPKRRAHPPDAQARWFRGDARPDPDAGGEKASESGDRFVKVQWCSGSIPNSLTAMAPR